MKSKDFEPEVAECRHGGESSTTSENLRCSRAHAIPFVFMRSLFHLDIAFTITFMFYIELPLPCNAVLVLSPVRHQRTVGVHVLMRLLFFMCTSNHQCSCVSRSAFYVAFEIIKCFQRSNHASVPNLCVVSSAARFSKGSGL